jgi:hypothetical protein
MISTKLASVILLCATVTAPAFADPSDRYGYSHRYMNHANRVHHCPYRTAGGTLVDCNGWRNRSSVGWDNTCFNIPYMSSQSACSVQSGG